MSNIQEERELDLWLKTEINCKEWLKESMQQPFLGRGRQKHSSHGLTAWAWKQACLPITGHSQAHVTSAPAAAESTERTSAAD